MFHCVALLLAFVAPLFVSRDSSSGSQDALQILQTVKAGEHGVAAAMSSGAVPACIVMSVSSGGELPPSGSDQVLSTTVQDPNHPNEPWVVTTYRKPDESFAAFIKRHRDTVNAVRDALEKM